MRCANETQFNCGLAITRLGASPESGAPRLNSPYWNDLLNFSTHRNGWVARVEVEILVLVSGCSTNILIDYLETLEIGVTGR